jgi:hypothetical protein
MPITIFFMIAPANDFPVPYNYGANYRVRTCLPNPFPGKANCFPHKIIIIKCFSIHKIPMSVKMFIDKRIKQIHKSSSLPDRWQAGFPLLRLLKQEGGG